MTLSGLLQALLPDPSLRAVADAVGTPSVDVEGPPAVRPLVTAALAADAGAGRPVLAVTATEREAEELHAVAVDLLGADSAAFLPSWETLPHEKLSPRSDTVGARMQVFRRLAHPGGRPVKVVATSVRSLIQPIVHGLGELVPVELRVGEETPFERAVERLAELAYHRVDMVEKRGEFAVRGGILDVFPPTADHPVRVEFFGDEVSEIRAFAVADQRSLTGDDALVDEVIAHPCRELLLTGPVRERAEALSAEHSGDDALAEMLEKLSSGIPCEGMEALIPALAGEELQLLTDVLPEPAHLLLCDPEKVRRRAHDLVRTGNEFLEASWMAAADGGAAPIDLGASAYRALGDVVTHARDTDHPVWTVSQLTTDSDDVLRLDLAAVESYRGEVQRAFTDLRAHTASGGTGVLVVPGAGTAQRAREQLREAQVPAVVAGDGLGEPPAAGVVTIVRGSLEEGFSAPDLGYVVLTETDLTGGRGGTSTRDMRKMPSRRRNAVDPLALKPGDYVVHEAHGIGRYVEMVQRTVSGATREYLVLEYASSKRGQPGDRLFVPTDQLDEVSRYVGGELPTLNKLGGSDWKQTKAKARKAVK
jgi:transcription-repair coupling factor (superfamily II helicase)